MYILVEVQIWQKCCIRNFLWLNLFSVRISVTIKLGETEAIYKAKICMLFCSIGKGEGT